jgi:hypothetical protein
VLVHFEDMSYANLTHLFNQYRGSLACFSDDVQVRDAALSCSFFTLSQLCMFHVLSHESIANCCQQSTMMR